MYQHWQREMTERLQPFSQVTTLPCYVANFCLQGGIILFCVELISDLGAIAFSFLLVDHLEAVKVGTYLSLFDENDYVAILD